MDANRIKQIIEAALMAADEPLTVDRLVKLFKRGEVPIEELRVAVREGLEQLEAECETRGYELKRVSSGYRFQVKQELSQWISRLWEEKPPRYTRALLETLALIAYRQPVTRGDIEQVRGVAVSPNIIRTLLEREWIRVVGVREVPGKPSMYGTTKAFLDYFNLKSLAQMPPLEEIKQLIEPVIEIAVTEDGEHIEAADSETAGNEAAADALDAELETEAMAEVEAQVTGAADEALANAPDSTWQNQQKDQQQDQQRDPQQPHDTGAQQGGPATADEKTDEVVSGVDPAIQVGALDGSSTAQAPQEDSHLAEVVPLHKQTPG